MSKYKTFKQLKDELGDNYDKMMYDINLELLKKLDRANTYIKKHTGGTFGFENVLYPAEVKRLQKIIEVDNES